MTAVQATRRHRSRAWRRGRFALSWVAAVALLGLGVPRAVDISWHGVVPVLAGLHWLAVLGLAGLWVLGLVVHSFVLTAAAPGLTHRRALTLNVTGSALANVIPLGGAAGVELNRRMMRTWGIGGRGFTGYTFLTNLWDIGAKLLLPLVAIVVIAQAGETVVSALRLAALVAGIAFVAVAASGGAVLSSPRCATRLGRAAERVVRTGRRAAGRDGAPDLVGVLLDVRRECVTLLAHGWLRMSLGMVGYVALQGLLLGWCLHLTGAAVTVPDVVAGFAVERLLTVLPFTPGGVGLADLGLVGVLLALGGDPAGVAAGAVLFRAFVFVVEIPVGGGTLGVWLLGRRRAGSPARRRTVPAGAPRRIAHVTDVFLPRLGGIETHVDDLVRRQRARGLDAVVLTPTPGDGPDPDWVLRMTAREARRAISEYDVAHVHVSVLSPYGLGVARAALGAGVPTLVTVHSMWTGAGAAVRLATRAALRRWPVTWSAVSGAAAAAVRRTLGGVDVAVLPNAVDVTAWRGTRGSAHLAEPTGTPLTIVSVMRLMPRKRPVQLLSIFEQVRALAPQHDVRLLIVGAGPLRRRVERHVARRGLTGAVHLTGRVPRAQVREHLLSSSVYVAPAAQESFGIAALEARCAGLPVVASRRSGVGEFVRDRVEGLLVADDSEMAVALAELVLDPALRARIAAHNRRVSPPVDWDAVLDRTDALYGAAGERVGTALPASAPAALAAVGG